MYEDTSLSFFGAKRDVDDAINTALDILELENSLGAYVVKGSGRVAPVVAKIVRDRKFYEVKRYD
jgi:hypothetical protein